jgi:hypothetical protein
MGVRPKSLREALLHELCVGLGYCNDLKADALAGDFSADEIVRMVLVAEGMDPVMTDKELVAPVARMVDDWLFSPGGRGAKSGLPR